MNEMKITPDDPRLTAFALGELEGDEARAVAAAVAREPALAAVVAEVRALAGDLEGVLAAEPLPTVTAVAASELRDAVYPFTPRRVRRFPVFWVSGLMAAGFALLLVVHNRNLSIASHEEVIHYELDLTRLAPADAATAPDASTRGGAVVVVAETAEPPAPRPTKSAGAPPDGEHDPLHRPLSVARDDAPDAPVVVHLGAQAHPVPGAPAGSDVAPSDQAVAAGTVNLPTMVVEISREEAMRASDDRPVEKPGLATAVASGSPTPGDALLQAAVADTSALVPNGFGGENGWGWGGGGRMALAAPPPVAPDGAREQSGPRSSLAREGFAAMQEQLWQRPGDAPISTFAADVDTVSYSNVRRFLLQGRLPPLDAVRIEEWVNAFTYDYAPPAATAVDPVAAHLEVAAAPWAAGHKLVRIGLKARELANANRAPANLVFLLDVSGSMAESDKLPLAIEAMRLLVGQLRADDRVAIVTYADSARLALPSTPVVERRRIEAELDRLTAGGSTPGSNGLELAYEVAKAHVVAGGVNRVILCTDGDFDVGLTGSGELERLIAAQAEAGVFLTALGFGRGNRQDRTLETLANRGNGSHAIIDSEAEARRRLVEQVEGTLATVAQDVKIEVEFNPQRVAAYRLIGYENRALAAAGFAADARDGAGMGAGQSVTALYEIVPHDGGASASSEEARPLRYQRAMRPEAVAEFADELLVVRVRAKVPGATASAEWSFPLLDRDLAFEAASEDFRFASAVAGLGLVLRDSPHRGTLGLADVRRWAEQALGFDPAGRRRDFLALVDRVQALLAP